METFKIKFFAFVCIIVFLVQSFNVSAHPGLNYGHIYEILSIFSGIISIDDDIMKVDSNNSDDIIESIEVVTLTGETVFSVQGCLTSECEVTLAHLPRGEYEVFVDLSLTGCISQEICLN